MNSQIGTDEGQHSVFDHVTDERTNSCKDKSTETLPTSKSNPWDRD